MKMQYQKRQLCLSFLSLLILSLLIFGCGPKDKKNRELKTGQTELYIENGLPKDVKVKITAFFPVMGYGKDYFEYAVKTFEKKFPNIEIDVHYTEPGNAGRIINALLQGGNNDEMYNWIYRLSNFENERLGSMGRLEDQKELLDKVLYDQSKIKVEEILFLNSKDFISASGKLYVPPLGMSICGLFYNKKMFKENGWEVDINNWDEFLILSDKIKSQGINPLVMAGKYPSYFDYGWGVIPYAIGGDKYKDDIYNLKPDIYVSEPFITQLKRLEEYSKRKYLHPGTASFDHTQSQMEFLQGKAAMITNATWIANEMRDVVSADFEWGFMPFPGNDKGKERIIKVSAGGYGIIWKDKPELERKWAKEFNLWLLNMDVQKKFAQGGGVPVRRDFIDNPENLKGISPSVAVALESLSLPDVKLISTDTRARIISNAEMAKLNKVTWDGYIEIISGEKTSEQVAKKINVQYMKGLAAERK